MIVNTPPCKVKKNIVKKLRSSALVSNLYYGLHIDDLMVAVGSKSYNASLDKAISKFAPEIISDKGELEKLKKAIKHSYYVCKANPEEYFLLGLSECDDKQQKAFVTDKFMYMTMGKLVSRKKHDAEIEDKFNFYNLAKPYFKRVVIKVNGPGDYDEFAKMALTVHDLILKPLDASMGSGIFAAYVNSEDEAKKVFESLMDKGGSWVVEERIKQSAEMAVWNSSSVNTVRFLSFNNKKTGFHGMKPFLRTGRKGAVVDNAGSGGVFANVDVATGRLSTCGIDEMGRRYECHPDSGVKFEGWQIPRYDELVSTVKEMHLNIMPDHPYIGWDMALTDEGWVVIECNWGQLVNQYVDHIGLKNEFMEYVTGK